MKKALSNLSKSELIDLARTVQNLEKITTDRGPQDDDELWVWLKDNLGLIMPRNAVQEGHCTPFQLICDLYFGRVNAAFALGSRGSSKTFGVAIVHLLNSLYKKDYEGLSAGAIMAQSNVAYAHFQKFIKNFPDAVISSSITKTTFVTGSEVSIVPGTVSALNGPHVQFVHLDEIELFDPQARQEAINIPVPKKLEDGTYYPTQVVFTSTRKRPGGPVQKILDQIDKEIASGEDPPYKLYKWNCYDVAENQPSCRVANPDLPEDQKCNCNKVVSGKWDDGTTRTFEDACGGKLAKSEGWIKLDALHNIFKTSDKDTWEAQQECKKPSREGLIYANLDKEKHGIRNYQPKPEYGNIYQGLDPGGSNPHAVVWIQVLNVSIEVERFDGKKIILPEGARVVFKEIYKAEISNSELADEIAFIEDSYRQIWPNWHVTDRFADPAAKAARLEFKKHPAKLVTHFKATREVSEHIKIVKNLIDNDFLYVDIVNCPMWLEEHEVWRWQEKKGDELDKSDKPVKDFDHLCVSGDTEVLIENGVATADSLCGKTVKVLTIDGDYKPAKWDSYGKQKLFKITLDDGQEIFATKDHRWHVRLGMYATEVVTTNELTNRIIPFQKNNFVVEDYAAYAEGCRHGMIFGDGTSHDTGKYKYSWMLQYGEVNCEVTKKVFGKDLVSKIYPSDHLGCKIRTKMMPYEYKFLPREDEELDYLYGFMAGLIAADGHISKNAGECIISQTDNMDGIYKICQKLGLIVTRRRDMDTSSGTYAGGRKSEMIAISRQSMTDLLVLKDSFKPRLRKQKAISGRKVISVEETDRYEEVYCCNEPETNTWTMGNFLLTGNCDATKYCIANVAMLELNNRKFSGTPASVEHGVVNPMRKYSPKASDMGQEPWRKQFGGIPLGRRSGRR